MPPQAASGREASAHGFQHMEVERGRRVVGVGHGVEPLVADLTTCLIRPLATYLIGRVAASAC